MKFVTCLVWGLFDGEIVFMFAHWQEAFVHESGRGGGEEQMLLEFANRVADSQIGAANENHCKN